MARSQREMKSDATERTSGGSPASIRRSETVHILGLGGRNILSG